MLKLEQTRTFKKCLKKYKHKKPVLDELKKIVGMLVNAEQIPLKYKDHELSGDYKGIRELHLKPDDLLLYVKKNHEKIILMAMGSHSEIF
jgi:mRNA interferase YafQ